MKASGISISWRTFRALAAMLCICAASGGPFVSMAMARQAGGTQATVAVSSDSIELGDSLIYQLTLDGVSNAEPPAKLSAGGAKVEYLGGHDESSRSIMTINGRTTERNILRYIMQWRVTPERKGPGAIEGFTFETGGHKIDVPRTPFTVTEARPNPNFRLTLESDATTAYVGEPIRMRLVWLLGNQVRSASFSGSDGGSEFDIAPLDPRPLQSRGKPLQQNEPYRAVPFLNGDAIITQSQAELDGRVVPSFILDIVVTPRRPGKIEVGPFRVAIDEVVGQRPRSFMDSFFDDLNKTRRSVIASNSLVLDVLPLPTEGKPADFAGLIGVYSVEAKAGNAEANVGDPVPLTVTISGPEPMDSIKPPNLEMQQDFATEFKPSPEGWESPAGVLAAPGERVFATTIRPKSANVTEIPPIRLPYFDTKTGKYSVAMSKPIPLKVRAAREFTAADALRPGGAAGFSPPAAVASTLTSAAPGIEANSESLDALQNQRVGLLAAATSPVGFSVLLLPPLGLAIAAIASLRNRATDPERARRKSAVRKARSELAAARKPSDVLGAVRTALAPFIGARPEAIAASDPAESPLPAATASLAQELLQGLEGAAFDGGTIDMASAKSQANELFSMLNR